MTKKVLLWVGFISGIAIVSFPSLMLVERIRELRESKPKQTINKESSPEHGLDRKEQEEIFIVEKKARCPEMSKNGVIFQYIADTAQKVFVAGTFSNWDGRCGVMTKNAEGVWEATLKIKPGRYTYKFKVDGIWFLDPQNPVSADDGKGGMVSVLIVE